MGVAALIFALRRRRQRGGGVHHRFGGIVRYDLARVRGGAAEELIPLIRLPTGIENG